MRALRWLARGLLLALLALILAIGWLGFSTSGLRLVADQLAARGLFEAAWVEGRLLGRMEAEGVRLPGQGLDIGHIVFEWRPQALLHGRLHIEELTASRLRLQPSPSAPQEDTGPTPGLALPIEVKIDRLRIDDLALRQDGEEMPLMHTLDARLRLAGSILHIEQLGLVTPWAAVQASGQLGLRPQDRVALALHWTAAIEGLTSPLEGAGSLSGSLQKIELDQRLTRPAAAHLQGFLEPLAAGLPWQARLEMDAFAPHAWLEGVPELGAWALGLAAEGDLGGADVRTIELQQGERSLQGEGRLDWAAGLALEARLSWQKLAWPLVGTPNVESRLGSLRLSGTPKAYRVQGEAQVSAPGQPEADLALQGSGDTAHLAIEALTLRALGGALEGQGELHWMPAVRWQVALAARDLHPEVLLPAWPGSLSASLRSAGELRDGRAMADIEIQHLHGSLRGYPVQASLSGKVDGTRLVLDHLALRSGQSLVQAQGSVDETLDLALTLDSPDLGELVPGAAGVLKGSAKLQGSLRQPSLQGAFEGRGLGWQEWQVQTLRAQAEGGPSPQDALSLRLELAGVQRLGQALLESAELSLNGTLAAHELDLVLAQGPQGVELGLSASGRWQAGEERLRIQRGQLSRTPLGDWASLGAVELVASATALDLPRWCWGQGTARLCLAGDWAAGQGASARLDATGFDLARISPGLAAARLRLTGQLAGEARLEAASGRPLTLAIRLAGEDCALHIPANGEGWQALPLREARMEARLGGGDGRLDLLLGVDEANRLEAHLGLPGLRLEEGLPASQPLAGSIALDYRDTRLLPALVPALREPRGVLSGRVQLGGTLGAPRVTGGVRLAEASVALPDLGIRIEEGEIALDSGQGSILSLHGGARLGQGHMAIDGRIDLAGLPDWQAEFDLSGDDLTLLRLPEAQVQASPELKIAMQPGAIRVSGRVEVPQALFELGGETPAAARTSEDVRILGEEPPARQSTLHADLDLRLGDAVEVRGLGFSGRIGGRLRVIDAPGLAGPLGRGELAIVDGRYKAYGQDLAIEEGRIIYTDTPLDDPALDIRAVRRGIQDGTLAGVRISGRASRPRLSLFSEPAMEQAEVLAYLVTGRSLQQSSGNDASLLLQAARTAGLAQGDVLAGQIGNLFGLEEATIESDAGTAELSLVLGRYLTPRLYLRYAQGLEEGLQTLALRYDLTRHVQVQLQSGIKAGVDVFYTLERE